MYVATEAGHPGTMGVPVAMMGIEAGGGHSDRDYANLESIAPTVEILKRFIRKQRVSLWKISCCLAEKELKNLHGMVYSLKCSFSGCVQPGNFIRR